MTRNPLVRLPDSSPLAAPRTRLQSFAILLGTYRDASAGDQAQHGHCNLISTELWRCLLLPIQTYCRPSLTRPPEAISFDDQCCEHGHKRHCLKLHPHSTQTSKCLQYDKCPNTHYQILSITRVEK